MSSLNEIGFYTLTDDRAKIRHSNMERCELIVTSSCNFNCPYCRGISAYSRNCTGHMDLATAQYVIDQWAADGLRAIRFSGGEPTVHPSILDIVSYAWWSGIERIAISSNGSQHHNMYRDLMDAGVNDFSISLDACCAEDADKMAGRSGVFSSVVENIRWLSERTYVTVGIVLTEETQHTVVDVIKFAHDLGVADIRIISAAQYDGRLSKLDSVPNTILEAHPILKYRVSNLLSGRNVRGLKSGDSDRCYIVLDDSVVAGTWHFPCVIYMREGGEPIGKIGDNMRHDREQWSKDHNTQKDPICKKNCLDCLVDYNNIVTLER